MGTRVEVKGWNRGLEPGIGALEPRDGARGWNQGLEPGVEPGVGTRLDTRGWSPGFEPGVAARDWRHGLVLGLEAAISPSTNTLVTTHTNPRSHASDKAGPTPGLRSRQPPKSPTPGQAPPTGCLQPPVRSDPRVIIMECRVIYGQGVVTRATRQRMTSGVQARSPVASSAVHLFSAAPSSMRTQVLETK